MIIEKFKPTHRISYGQHRILVRCVDSFGPCYRKIEWLYSDHADWEFNPAGYLTYMGVKIPQATMRKIKLPPAARCA